MWYIHYCTLRLHMYIYTCPAETSMSSIRFCTQVSEASMSIRHHFDQLDIHVKLYSWLGIYTFIPSTSTIHWYMTQGTFLQYTYLEAVHVSWGNACIPMQYMQHRYTSPPYVYNWSSGCFTDFEALHASRCNTRVPTTKVGDRVWL